MNEFPKILADLKLVKKITGQIPIKVEHKMDNGCQKGLLKLYKFFRFIFITIYYYIFPFLIVILSDYD